MSDGFLARSEIVCEGRGVAATTSSPLLVKKAVSSVEPVRYSGVTIPLFSIRSRADWGIGQITDLVSAAELFARAGMRLLQVLPTHELAGEETSPYGAVSAFALDPIYITIESVPDLNPELIAKTLGGEGLAELDRLRAAKTVQYGAVRTLKRRVLREAFNCFKRELANNTARAREFLGFIAHEGDWLRDHALYAAIRASHNGWGWSTWPEAERDRAPEVLALAWEPRDDGGLGTRVLEEMYLQWIAHEQWMSARRALKRIGVLLMGDMPFIISNESADVWAHREQFQTDVSLGAPPDEFSADGQSWGLPAYNWEVMDRDELAWLRSRARRSAELFDRFRIDHVVGLFRQWIKKEGEAAGRFDPSEEDAQKARGEKVLRAMIDAAGRGTVIAEDLGVIPPFVRETMSALELPGYKVLPWERDDSQQPHSPTTFPEQSVSTWSTHDTLPITQWWYELQDWERERLANLDGIPLDLPEGDRELRLIKLLFSARSNLSLLLAQEILGDKSRINLPGTVTEHNWTWRLDRTIEELKDDAGMNTRLSAIRDLAQAAGR